MHVKAGMSETFPKQTWFNWFNPFQILQLVRQWACWTCWTCPQFQLFCPLEHRAKHRADPRVRAFCDNSFFQSLANPHAGPMVWPWNYNENWHAKFVPNFNFNHCRSWLPLLEKFFIAFLSQPRNYANLHATVCITSQHITNLHQVWPYDRQWCMSRWRDPQVTSMRIQTLNSWKDQQGGEKHAQETVEVPSSAHLPSEVHGLILAFTIPILKDNETSGPQIQEGWPINLSTIIHINSNLQLNLRFSGGH